MLVFRDNSLPFLACFKFEQVINLLTLLTADTLFSYFPVQNRKRTAAFIEHLYHLFKHHQENMVLNLAVILVATCDN